MFIPIVFISILMRLAKIAVVCGVGLFLNASSRSELGRPLHDRVSHLDVTRAMDCIFRKSGPISLEQEYYGDKNFRFRYQVGPVVSWDRKNELHLILYEVDIKKADLYEFVLEGSEKQRTVAAFNFGSVAKRGTRWVVTEAPGGEASRRRDQQVVDALSRAPMHTIAKDELKPTTAKCEIRY